MNKDCIHYVYHSYPIDLNLESVQSNPISHTKVQGMDFFLVNDADYIKYVFDNAANYQKVGLFIDVLKEVAGNGVATTDGSLWERQRRSLMPLFTKEKLDKLISKMNDVTLNYVNDLGKHIDEGLSTDIHEVLMCITGQIVLETLFSYKPSKEQLKELIEGGKEASKYSAKIAMMKKANEPITGNLALEEKKYRKTYDDFAYGLIRDRRNSTDKPNDLLQLLLDAQAQNRDITDLELRDQIMTMFIGGHDTCGNTLSWAMYLLSQNKTIQEQLRKEANEVVGNGEYTLENFPRLTLASNVFKETLRLFPPAFLYHRTAQNSDKIGDHSIPKGAIISLCPWVTHRNKKYWDEPFTFDPNRFISRPQLAPGYFPFGGGPHVCLGQGLAVRESPLILAAFVQHFNFDLIPEQTIETYGGVQLHPRYGMKMKLTRVKR